LYLSNIKSSIIVNLCLKFYTDFEIIPWLLLIPRPTSHTLHLSLTSISYQITHFPIPNCFWISDTALSVVPQKPMPPPPPPPRRNKAAAVPPPVPTRALPPPVPVRTKGPPPPPVPTKARSEPPSVPMTAPSAPAKSVGFKPPPPQRKAAGQPPPVPPTRDRRKSRISRISVSGKRSSVNSRRNRRRVGRCRWMKRNWFFLMLSMMAAAGFALAALLYLEPCPLVEVRNGQGAN
jgi:hypothetical protein